MRKTVTFGELDGSEEKLFEYETNKISFTRCDVERNRVFGEYQYESEPLVGSPTTAEGVWVYDREVNLFGLVTESDHPKPETIFRNITEKEDISVSLTAPEYPVEASQQFYRTYGFNGYTTAFRDNIRTYGLHSEYQHIEPDEVAERRARNSRRRISDELVDEVTEEFLNDGLYISSMDVMLEENGIPSLRFSNPMRITAIPEEEFGRDFLHLVCQRMTELATDSVKSISEVKDETK